MSAMHVIVCGAGVIGASIAYFLSRRNVAVTLVERVAVACAASGKSGGFLARDWCRDSPLGPLAETSFELHRALARTLPRDYGYRAVDTLLVSDPAIGAGGAGAAEPSAPLLRWIDGAVDVRGLIGTTDTTAQVDPGAFTHALVEAARRDGARLVLGPVEGVSVAEGVAGPEVRGVRVAGEELVADKVVFALGPWTDRLAAWLAPWTEIPPVVGLKGNSVILRPVEPIPAHALFIETADPSAGNISPEVYPRANGDVYVCGMADDLPIPQDPSAVTPSLPACAVLQAVVGRVSSYLDGAEIIVRQSCYRPITADALPLLGAIPNVAQAYLATGHNCWGILNAPASGLAMAELLLDGRASSVDLAPFTPSRFYEGSAGRGATNRAP